MCVSILKLPTHTAVHEMCRGRWRYLMNVLGMAFSNGFCKIGQMEAAEMLVADMQVGGMEINQIVSTK